MHNRVLLRSLLVWMLLTVVVSALPTAPPLVQAADTPAAPTTATITLSNNGFSPAKVTIAEGGVVTWNNTTTTAYTLESIVPNPAPNGRGVYLPLVAMNAGAATTAVVRREANAQGRLFSDQLAPNGSYRFQFVEEGRYEYFVVENPLFKGEIEVVEAPTGDPLKVNFQPSAAPVPAGYTADAGAAFDAARGYGWVREDSLNSANRVPLDVSARAADRNRAGIDQRNDTVVAMQPTGGPNAAWEYVLSEGTYSVTVGVGDGPPYTGSHTINVEGTRAISGFVGSATSEYTVATVVVAVLDGRLTIDGLGGQNTIINYVEIFPAGPVARPSVSATEPVDGATGVPFTGTSIQATVDLPLGVGLNPATVNGSTVRLLRGAISVPISVSLSAPNVILVRPTTAISPSTAYVLQLGDGIANTSGVKLVPYSLNFTTAVDPAQPGTIAVNPPELTLYRVEGTPTPTSRTVTITNTGAGNLRITGISIGGTNANKFGVSRPTLPITLTPNTSLNLTVVFSVTGAVADRYGPKRAELRIVSNADPAVPTTTVRLNGLGVAPNTEPSLQWILDALEIPVNVGDPDPANADFPGGANPVGEEVLLQQFQRAEANKPITFEPLAVFGPTAVDPITRFGIYRIGAPTGNRQEAFSITAATGKTIVPSVSGTLTITPTPQIGATFGLYSIWPNFKDAGQDRVVYSEDVLNSFDQTNNHKVRVYPYKEFDGTPGGSPVANAYIVAFEEFTGPYDFQDLVFIIRNVRPIPVDPCVGCNLAVRNEDNVTAGGMLQDDLLTFHTAVGRDPQRKTFDPTTGISLPVRAFVHEVVTLTLRNTGSGDLRVTGLPISTRWEILSRPTLPFTVTPGAEVPLRIRFKAQGGCPLAGGCPTGYVYRGSLAIQSNDPDESSKAIELRGYWQPAIEKSEPSLAQLIEIFGFKGNIPDTAKNWRALVTFTDDGRTGGYKAVGDEVLSPRWQLADPSQPMRVLSLATFHGCCVDQIRFRIRPDGENFSPQIQQLRDDAQTILPRNVQQTGFVQGSYTPTKPFVVFVDGYGSNRGVNNQTHALRFFPLRDDNGNVLPNTYVVGQDILGSFNSGPPTNYDYQDSAWLVTNIQPVGGSVVVGTPFDRINVGGGGFANPSGGVAWRADTGLFSPSVPSEPGANSFAIEGTDIPQLYRSYRGAVGRGNTFTINIPVGSSNLNANSEIGLRLHFAELYWGREGSGAPCVATDCRGRRVFDVSAEGQLIVDDLDIFGLSSGALRANVIPIERVRVTDGTLTLTFVASVDNPSISGIELLKLP